MYEMCLQKIKWIHAFQERSFRNFPIYRDKSGANFCHFNLVIALLKEENKLIKAKNIWMTMWYWISNIMGHFDCTDHERWGLSLKRGRNFFCLGLSELWSSNVIKDTYLISFALRLICCCFVSSRIWCNAIIF